MVCDPHAAPDEVKREYGIETMVPFPELKFKEYQAVVLTVAHREFAGLNLTEFTDIPCDCKVFQKNVKRKL